ncbi:tRNA (adenosine(37)-N6)-threonylcarbamoyltransferase complex ATPase subunit type 1 TsaE [uncultured Schumannella sp.]|uniref:tRNA (adenosine(37)-N6)-threonylcarbamoyltransferase complex ATPase subunit type 1 TsaE n=1 Tax=uncultured Schumannella sp. TaxID=1195956 RepID=UPI0025F2A536|nr:tRNA (adenosine(37)-N6)-threonylcarbamoyltransferase complex ATPase subunit type 1 TsaE [uncultured Schumannella sp.]
MFDLIIPDAEAMESFGARLAPLLRAGDLVRLDGELGAGKTTFTRGLGAALGARGAITSPTFVLAREHPTASGVPLVHVDAYRLSSGRDVDDLDLDLDGSIVVVEWGAGKLDDIEAWLGIEIERPHGGADVVDADADPELADEPRAVRVIGVGERGRELEGALYAALDADPSN